MKKNLFILVALMFLVSFPQISNASIVYLSEGAGIYQADITGNGTTNITVALAPVSPPKNPNFIGDILGFFFDFTGTASGLKVTGSDVTGKGAATVQVTNLTIAPPPLLAMQVLMPTI